MADEKKESKDSKEKVEGIPIPRSTPIEDKGTRVIDLNWPMPPIHNVTDRKYAVTSPNEPSAELEKESPKVVVESSMQRMQVLWDPEQQVAPEQAEITQAEDLNTSHAVVLEDDSQDINLNYAEVLEENPQEDDLEVSIEDNADFSAESESPRSASDNESDEPTVSPRRPGSP